MYQGETNDVVKEFRAIKQEYAFNPDIMSPEDPRVARLKEIIDTKLSQVDKTIILLYCDCLSYRKLGQKMHLSHMTIRREVLRIKKIILDEYNNGNNDRKRSCNPGCHHQEDGYSGQDHKQKDR